MKISFKVDGLPPKKDGANSMWRKGAEIPRLKALRTAAYQGMQGHALSEKAMSLTIRVYATPKDGDLDNFTTGICDGLMAAHPRTPIDVEQWIDLPVGARPSNPIVFLDDSQVWGIHVERLPPDGNRTHYEVVLEWRE